MLLYLLFAFALVSAAQILNGLYDCADGIPNVILNIGDGTFVREVFFPLFLDCSSKVPVQLPSGGATRHPI